MMEHSKENVNAKKGATAAKIVVLIVVSIVMLAGGWGGLAFSPFCVFDATAKTIVVSIVATISVQSWMV